jgi:hypothetical protein
MVKEVFNVGESWRKDLPVCKFSSLGEYLKPDMRYWAYCIKSIRQHQLLGVPYDR